MPDILKIAAAKFSARFPHSLREYVALILSILFVHLFSINKSLGKEINKITEILKNNVYKNETSKVLLFTNPRIITSALFP